MGGRPRTPAKVLQLRGSFKRHPERKRTPAAGAGPFEQEPPTHLPAECAPAWHYVVQRLPVVALTSSDEVAVEMAARCLHGIWQLGPMGFLTKEFKGLNDSLRQWLGKLGMTPADREKLAPAPDKPSAGNAFVDA